MSTHPGVHPGGTPRRKSRVTVRYGTCLQLVSPSTSSGGLQPARTQHGLSHPGAPTRRCMMRGKPHVSSATDWILCGCSAVDGRMMGRRLGRLHEGIRVVQEDIQDASRQYSTPVRHSGKGHCHHHLRQHLHSLEQHDVPFSVGEEYRTSKRRESRKIRRNALPQRTTAAATAGEGTHATGCVTGASLGKPIAPHANNGASTRQGRAGTAKIQTSDKMSSYGHPNDRAIDTVAIARGTSTESNEPDPKSRPWRNVDLSNSTTRTVVPTSIHKCARHGTPNDQHHSGLAAGWHTAGSSYHASTVQWRPSLGHALLSK